MPYVIRGEDFILEDTEVGNEGKEMEFETYEEAERARELLLEGFPIKDAKLEIAEV